MNDQQIFRALTIAAFVTILPIGVYFRLKSQATRERLDRRQEGIVILATLRPVGAMFWFGVLAWMINPAWMAWSSVTLPDALRWIGVGALASACGLLLWTFGSLGPNLTDTVVTRKAHTLILHGPYQWVRHPLYVAVALFTAALSLITQNWFLLVTGAAACGLLVVRTRVEEANLLARFGDSYRGYMDRTGRFVPRRARVTPDITG
jgi:protein-S-isoprenylcysteine O-methyltransferase Ste14